jgi:hypothetical protein
LKKRIADQQSIPSNTVSPIKSSPSKPSGLSALKNLMKLKAANQEVEAIEDQLIPNE